MFENLKSFTGKLFEKFSYLYPFLVENIKWMIMILSKTTQKKHLLYHLYIQNFVIRCSTLGILAFHFTCSPVYSMFLGIFSNFESFSCKVKNYCNTSVIISISTCCKRDFIRTDSVNAKNGVYTVYNRWFRNALSWFLKTYCLYVSLNKLLNSRALINFKRINTK